MPRFRIIMLCSVAVFLSFTSKAQCLNTLTLSDTLHVCPGGTVAFDAVLSGPDSILSTVWSPSNGVSNVDILDPTCAPPAALMYHLDVKSINALNLMTNGDFSQGNVGFTSSYTFAPNSPSALYPEGVYVIVTDPFLDHNGAVSFPDHTTGTGNMMAVNGAGTPVDVWCQSITVQPNTDYDFAAWAANWSTADVGDGEPHLQFKINGTLIGSVFALGQAPGVWEQFFTTWNSGGNTTADICIYDLNTATNGNDFALDDISFRQICDLYDSVYVAIPQHDLHITADNVNCSRSFHFFASDPDNANATFLWNYGDGNTASGGNVTHVYAGSGPYDVNVVETDAYGCTATSSTTATTTQVINMIVSADTTICNNGTLQLLALGANQVTWSPATGLSNPNIPNPVATVTGTITYHVHGVSNDCSTDDSVTIRTVPSPVIKASGDANVCGGTPVQLSVTGSDSVVWRPGYRISNPYITNPIVSPSVTTDYIVTGYSPNGCFAEDTVVINTIAAPQLYIASSGNIDCNNSSATLDVSGALNYVWHPASYFSDSTSPHQVVSPAKSSTVFYVTGTDTHGCKGTDSIVVKNDGSNAVFMATAFTPNADGKNDIISPLIFCDFKLEKFAIYNRWGVQVFATDKVNDGWDGTLNGVPQSLDTYYYFVKGHRESTNEDKVYKGNFTLIR